jgi:hypothetical protein
MINILTAQERNHTHKCKIIVWKVTKLKFKHRVSFSFVAGMSIYSFPFIHFLFSSNIVKVDGFLLASSTHNSFLEILSLCYGVHKFHVGSW